MKKRILLICISCAVLVLGVYYIAKHYKQDEMKNNGEVDMLELDMERSNIREDYQIRNQIAQIESEYTQMTFLISETDYGVIPYQSGIVVPDFMPQERIQISLGGTWKKKRFDSDYIFSLEPRSVEWIAKAEEEANNAHLINFDDSEWDEKNLPAPENNMSGEESTSGAEPYEGGVWYRRVFTLGDEIENKQVFLKSLGISYICDIWINGHWVGYHEGGFTPFAFDISPYLQISKPNVIFIRVDNPPWGKRLDTIPALDETDFFNYTGIIQDIYIEATGRVFIPRADFVTKNINGDVECQLIVSNYLDEDVNITIKREIYEADKSKYKYSPDIAGLITDKKVYEQVTAETINSQEDKKLIYKFEIEDPKLWDVLEPNLYISRITILDNDGNVLDTLHTQFGIRTIETEHTKMLLNGENYFARGIARHEEWPLYGRTASWDRIVSDFDQMLEMNVNFIRTGHYPNHVYTYLYLDRLGIPSMSEIPLWKLEPAHFTALTEKGLAVQMFREMVFSQYNSPSVILWSTQNECTGVQKRKEYNEMMVADIRRYYDDGRLMTQSAAADQGGPKDASMEPLDVNGWTMYFGTFHGGTAYNGTKSFLDKVGDYWDKPIINTEFGTWSGESDGDSIKQLQVYQKTFYALMEYANITPKGSYNEDGILAGIDYWIMYNWYVNHNNWIDTFGIYHMDREQMKVVGRNIYDDYTMLKDNLKNPVDSIDDHLITDKEMNSFGQEIEVELNAGVDYSKYSFLNINCKFSQTNAMVHVILEDADGKQWDFYTDRVDSNKEINLIIPIYKINGIDTENITKLTLKYAKESTVEIKEIYLSN